MKNILIKKKKIEIGLLFTSQDRYELTRLSITTAIQGINTDKYNVTILWLDGSIEQNSKNFFQQARFSNVKLIKKSGYRNLGAASVIQIGMNILQNIGKFDWVGMFESDCYFLDHWLDKCMDSLKSAEKDGLKVGVITPYSLTSFVLESKQYYNINQATGASCSLIRSSCWNSIPPALITHNFRTVLIKKFWSRQIVHGSKYLGWDWIFSLSVYANTGYVTVSPRITAILNCGFSDYERNTKPIILYNDEFTKLKIKQIANKLIKPNLSLWEKTIKTMHNQSDAAIISYENIDVFPFLMINFQKTWFSKESNVNSWWRWAGGNAEVEIINTKSESISINLIFELVILDPNQKVEVLINQQLLKTLTKEDNILRLKTNLNMGKNVLKFIPKTPGKKYLQDERLISFAIRHGYHL